MLVVANFSNLFLRGVFGNFSCLCVISAKCINARIKEISIVRAQNYQVYLDEIWFWEVYVRILMMK
jgi:hypothetical protein